MNIVIDIIIVLLIVFCTYRGYKQGLIGVAFSVVSFFIALLIAFLLFVPVSNLVIENTGFDEKIKTTIIENFSTKNEGEQENSQDFVSEYIEKYMTDVKNAGVEAAATQISINGVKAISFIGIFILAKIALVFFKALANLIAKLPILKQFNTAGGIIVGLLKGLLIVYIALAIMLLVSPMFKSASVYKAIDSSYVGKTMYSNNIILKLFNL